MDKFSFGQPIDVGNDAIQLGAELGAGHRVGDAVGVVAQAHGLRQVVEFRRGADEFGGALDNGGKGGVGCGQAGDGELVDVEHIHIRENLLSNKPVTNKTRH